MVRFFNAVSEKICRKDVWYILWRRVLNVPRIYYVIFSI